MIIPFNLTFPRCKDKSIGRKEKGHLFFGPGNPHTATPGIIPGACGSPSCKRPLIRRFRWIIPQAGCARLLPKYLSEPLRYTAGKLYSGRHTGLDADDFASALQSIYYKKSRGKSDQKPRFAANHLTNA